MNRLELHIDRVSVETEAEAHELKQAEPTIQEAFRLFAERIDRTPFRQFAGAKQQTIQTLRTSVLRLDELLGPRGAERLADELYRELGRRIGES